jgi:hypothetical protein
MGRDVEDLTGDEIIYMIEYYNEEIAKLQRELECRVKKESDESDLENDIEQAEYHHDIISV